MPKTIEQVQSECNEFKNSMGRNRFILLSHYQDGDWKRFKDNRGRPAYKHWSTFVKNEYLISKSYANRLLRAALIEQELGLPEGIHIKESVLRVLWSVDRNVETNKKAYEIAQGLAAFQALAKGRRSMPITAKIMERALLIACGKEPANGIDETVLKCMAENRFEETITA